MSLLSRMSKTGEVPGLVGTPGIENRCGRIGAMRSVWGLVQDMQGDDS